MHAALEATALGKIVTDDDLQAQKRIEACCDLIDLLPPRSIAFVCGKTEAELDHLSAERAVSPIIAYSRKWKHTTIYATFRAWTTFLAWLSTLEDDFEESPNDQISLLLLTEFAAWYNERAVARCAARARPFPSAPGQRAPQDGHGAADKKIDDLAFLARRFGVLLPCAMVPKFGQGPGVARCPPTPARPFSLKMVVYLERFLLEGSPTPVLRGFVAALLFCVFGGHRVRQAQQQVWFYEAHGVLFGRCNDKSGKPRRTFTPLEGLQYGDRWFRILRTALEGVESGGFIFRAFMSPNGRIDHPGATFLNAPMDSQKIASSLRLVLRLACPFLSDADIASFTLHSARHVINEVGKGRCEQSPARVELSRWAHSTGFETPILPTLKTRTRKRSCIPHRS